MSPARTTCAARGAARTAGLLLAAMLMLCCAVGMPVAAAQPAGDFDVADTNHDGRVSLQEFEAYASQRLLAAYGRRAQRFRSLSPQEQSAALQRRFDRLDHGHKGYLDRSDWKKE